VDPEEIEEVGAPVDEGASYDETDPAGESGSTDGAPAAETVADPYADFGGRESVEQAMALHKATQSQDGLMRLFFEAGRSQGLSYSQMEALFGQAAPEAPATAQYADDDLLTYAQVKELMQREVLEPMHQNQAQQAEAGARAVVNSQREALGVKDDATWNAVLQLGDRYLGDDLSPDAVRSAVQRGHADFINLVKSNATEYVTAKADARKTVPKAPSGGSMSTPAAEAEPKTVEEAIKRARQRLLGG
jgi:hypothetical protein